MKTTLLSRALTLVLLLATLSFRSAAPSATNTFSVKVNGKALSGKAGYNGCLLMMNAFNLGGNMADGSYVSLEFMPAAFPKLPATLPLGVQSLERYAKLWYYPKGLKEPLNMYSSSSGSITITSYDASARTISGTFSGKLLRQKNLASVPSDAIQLADGRFDVAFMKR